MEYNLKYHRSLDLYAFWGAIMSSALELKAQPSKGTRLARAIVEALEWDPRGVGPLAVPEAVLEDYRVACVEYHRALLNDVLRAALALEAALGETARSRALKELTDAIGRLMDSINQGARGA